MLRMTAIVLTFLCPTSAPAQPLSWGMAQCGALMMVMEDHVSAEPQKTYLADAANKMINAAQKRSLAEGHDPDQLAQVFRQKREEWTAMGYTMAFKAEFRDWTQYCRSLANAHNIPLHKSML